MGLLGWAFLFLGIALVAGLLGFTGLAAGAATIARVIFGVFLLVFLALFLMAMLGVCTATTVVDSTTGVSAPALAAWSAGAVA